MKEIKFELRFREIDTDGVENYSYQPQTGDFYYHVQIANNADWTIQTMIQYLQTEFRKIPGLSDFTVKQFGGSTSFIEFKTNDDDVMIKLYPSDNDIYNEMNIDVNLYNVSTEPYSTFINTTSLPSWVSDIRNFTLPTNTFSNIDDLANTLQNSFDLITLNKVEDKFTILSTPENKITCFNRKIIKFVDNEFFENDVFLSFFTSNEIIFTPPVLNFDFPEGSYDIENVETVLTANLNSLSSGYVINHEPGIFKIEIKNSLKKFKLLFSKYDSIFRQLGFQNQDTEYSDFHISHHTLNLDACDAILINIVNIPTIINTKNTSGCFQ